MPSSPASARHAGWERTATSCTAGETLREMLVNSLPPLSQQLCRKRWLLGTSQQGTSAGGLHPSIPPTGIMRVQPMNTAEEADINSTWDSGSTEQTEKRQINTKTTMRKVFQWFEGKKNATNDEERGQARDTVSESTEYIVTREPNAPKTTAKWWKKPNS